MSALREEPAGRASAASLRAAVGIRPLGAVTNDAPGG
jgi:hypothetical protein